MCGKGYASHHMAVSRSQTAAVINANLKEQMMNYTILSAKCSDQSLCLISAPLIASGGMNETKLTVEFSSEWNQLKKTAVFYRTEDAVYHVLMEEDFCFIPREVLMDDGIFCFGIMGTKGDTVKTSEIVRYSVRKGAVTEATAVPDPTPDIYAQIIDRVAAIENVVRPEDGVGDYKLMRNKPRINGVTLDGNKTTKDLGIEIPKNASEISYNNLSGAVDASDVQSAIDKLSENKFFSKADGELITVCDASENIPLGLNIYGRCEQTGIPSAESPAVISHTGAGGVLGVILAGNNLLRSVRGWTDSYTHNGVTYTANPDGSVTVTGTAAGASYAQLSIRGFAFANGVRYTLSGGQSDVYLEIGYFTDDTTANYQTIGRNEGEPLSFTGNGKPGRVYLRVREGLTVDCTIFPMLNTGDQALAYESYVDNQVLELNTSGGLCGVPVESGGNYTDSNGQQWICDEIDLEKGILIKRTGRAVYDGSDDEDWRYNGDGMPFWYIKIGNYGAVVNKSGISDRFVCSEVTTNTTNTGFYVLNSPAANASRLCIRPGVEAVTDLETWKAWLAGNPTEIIWRLAAPEEIYLSDEEIHAYSILCMNAPVTNILTNSNAGIRIEYALSNSEANMLMHLMKKLRISLTELE